MGFARILAAVAATVMLAGPVHADQFSADQKKEIEKLVREYLLQNPELLTEMSNLLETKQKQAEDEARTASLKANADYLYRHPNDGFAGNANGDVIMVEFLDYNCGWCKKAVSEVGKLVESDKNLKVVFKEFPIFGEGSTYAAKAVLAAVKQGKYWELHQALYAQESQIVPEVVDEVAQTIGIDVTKMKADMELPEIAETLLRNEQLAKDMLLSGTPAFVIDEHVVPGYLPASQLAEAVASIRESGGCKVC